MEKFSLETSRSGLERTSLFLKECEIQAVLLPKDLQHRESHSGYIFLLMACDTALVMWGGESLFWTRPCDCLTLSWPQQIHKHSRTTTHLDATDLWHFSLLQEGDITVDGYSLFSLTHTLRQPPASVLVPPVLLLSVSQGDARRSILLYRESVFTIRFLQMFMEIPCGW